MMSYRWLSRGATAVAVATALTLTACSSGPATPSGTPARPATTKTTTATATATTTAAVATTSPAPSPRSIATTSRPTTTNSEHTSSASCAIPSSLRGVDVEVLPTSQKAVALTFDAGASNDGVGAILGTLAREGVPATFFLTGDFIDDFPASARAMAKYPVGNHTYDHPDLTTLTDAGVRTQLRSAAAKIRAVTGRDPKPLFRFPFGAVDRHAIGLVNAECYVPFRWTVDTLGWEGVTGGQSVDSVVSRVMARARPGEIVLMHVGAHPEDHSTLDADALPRVIAGLRAKGYRFVTLDSVLPHVG